MRIILYVVRCLCNWPKRGSGGREARSYEGVAMSLVGRSVGGTAWEI